MTYFPLFIDIKGRKCLLAGGGKVALRKVRTLLAYKADVQLIALSVDQELAELLPEEAFRKGLLREDDLEGAALVVAATSSRDENHRIAMLCHDRNIPVNVIDCPEECSFLFPAVVKRGDVSIGINTGARSPGLSRHIREQIQEAVPDWYGDLADRIGEVRDELKGHVSDEAVRRRMLSEILDRSLREERVLSREETREMLNPLDYYGTIS